MMSAANRALCLAVAAFVFMAGCGDSPSEPEAELRAWVDAGIAFVEAKQRRAVVGMVSEAYADGRGNERSDLDKLLRVYFHRMNNIKLLPKIEEITIYGDTAAQLVLTVGMAGTNEGVLGFSADAYRFELEVEKDGTDWHLVSARWGELGDELR
ncbi:MAG: hypothetical protein QNJ11_00630 [Woeseiaceae bacterium]|nr:hypothetical protein [Woeseiaceae bacterium]